MPPSPAPSPRGAPGAGATTAPATADPAGTAAAPDPDRDWALWHRARGGCAASAQALVQRLTPGAYALAWQMLRRREDAEDAVQDAFVRLWRSRPDDDRGARLSTYFLTIVVNRCRSHATARRELATDPELLQQQADDPGPGGPAPAADPAQRTPLAERVAGFAPGALAQRLAAALAALPARQRMAVVMWAWGDAEPPQIAQALDLQPNAAHQLLHRARRALRAALDTGSTPPPPPAAARAPAAMPVSAARQNDGVAAGPTVAAPPPAAPSASAGVSP